MSGFPSQNSTAFPSLLEDENEYNKQQYIEKERETERGHGNNSVTRFSSSLLSTEGMICIKICSFGLVASKKWYSCYCVIGEKSVSLYEDREAAERRRKEEEILFIPIDKYTLTSSIKLKKYSQKNTKKSSSKHLLREEDEEKEDISLHSFYILHHNGVFPPTKLLKIGVLLRGQADAMRECVRAQRNYKEAAEE